MLLGKDNTESFDGYYQNCSSNKIQTLSPHHVLDGKSPKSYRMIVHLGLGKEELLSLNIKMNCRHTIYYSNVVQSVLSLFKIQCIHD